jgi:hypothetical protein
MKTQAELAHFSISISRTQARVRGVSKKLHVMKFACLLVSIFRSRPQGKISFISNIFFFSTKNSSRTTFDTQLQQPKQDLALFGHERCHLAQSASPVRDVPLHL